MLTQKLSWYWQRLSSYLLNNLRKFNENFRKDVFLDSFKKVTKNRSFTVCSKDIFFEKPQMESIWPLPRHIRCKCRCKCKCKCLNVVILQKCIFWNSGFWKKLFSSTLINQLSGITMRVFFAKKTSIKSTCPVMIGIIIAFANQIFL